MTNFKGKVKDGHIVPIEGQESVIEALPINEVLNVKVTKQRSTPHLRLYFAAIREAYLNWPETNEYQFESESHFRQWLEIEAGFKSTLSVPKSDNPDMMAAGIVAAIMQAQKEKTSGLAYTFIKYTDTHIIIEHARSVSFKKLYQDHFNQVSTEVSYVLYKYTGLTLEDYKKNFESAA